MAITARGAATLALSVHRDKISKAMTEVQDAAAAGKMQHVVSNLTMEELAGVGGAMRLAGFEAWDIGLGPKYQLKIYWGHAIEKADNDN